MPRYGDIRGGEKDFMTAEEFQKEYGKKKSLRKKSNAEINRAMTESFLEQCQRAGFPKPLCEFRFDPKRRWRVDFMFVHEKRVLAVEIEGTGHNAYYNFRSDMEKYNELTFAGIRLLRFTVKEVHSGTAIKQINRIIQGKP